MTVLGEPDFRRLLAWEVERANRYQDFLSVCLVKIESADAPPASLREAVARKFAELLRSSDLVGGIGDDVALVLVHTPETDAQLITRRVRDRIHELPLPGVERGVSVHVKLHLGLACFPSDATNPDELLARAQKILQKDR